MRGNIPQYQTVRDGCDPTFPCKTPMESLGIISSGPLNYRITGINMFHTFLRNDLARCSALININRLTFVQCKNGLPQ